MSAQQPHIFDFMDYREYLRSIYEFRKNTTRYFSYRYLAQKVDVEASSLVRICHGSLHIADEAISRVANYLLQEDREKLYFECLVRFCKTNNDFERRNCFEKMVRLREFQVNPLQKEQFEILSKWYQPVLRSLLVMEKEDVSPKSLAKRLQPSVDPEEITAAISLLLKIGLLKQSDHQTFQLPSAFLSPDAKVDVMAIRKFQHEMIRLADRALDCISPLEREISTVTVSLNPKDLPALQEHIRIFRKSILEISKESQDPEMVYQLNLQFFPLTVPRSNIEEL